LWESDGWRKASPHFSQPIYCDGPIAYYDSFSLGMPAHLSVVKTSHSIPLNRLVTKCCEKSGLEKGKTLCGEPRDFHF